MQASLPGKGQDQRSDASVTDGTVPAGAVVQAGGSYPVMGFCDGVGDLLDLGGF